MTYSDVSTDHEIHARLRAISINALREALIARNRYDMPFTDNDAAIVENIYHLLKCVEDTNDIQRSAQHEPLTVKGAVVTETQAQIAEALGLLDAEIRAETAAAQASRAGSTEA